MRISGMSGNEIYCLSLKGLEPGEIVVGNSVYSLGIGGALGAIGRSMVGGEITAITSMISEGRHAAIQRMEQEAQRHGSTGVTSVTSELRTLAGYTEFLAQGTGVHGGPSSGRVFSTSASGMDLFCQVDAGYLPIRFAMGNVAYALGLGRGFIGQLRTIARGEVSEFSQMYNEIRHLALRRLQQEAAGAGANAVVDITVKMLPFGPGTIELLMTGTASHHPRLSSGAVRPEQVVTSELTGEELWNLARLGWSPVRLVMATSVYSLGLVSGLSAMVRSINHGELPEITSLIYQARENCLELVRREAEEVGAERVIGNKLLIQEIAPGLIEVMALGTAIRRVEGMEPQTPLLPPQAIIVDRESIDSGSLQRTQALTTSTVATARQQPSPAGCLIAFLIFMFTGGLALLGGLLSFLMAR